MSNENSKRYQYGKIKLTLGFLFLFIGIFLMGIWIPDSYTYYKLETTKSIASGKILSSRIENSYDLYIYKLSGKYYYLTFSYSVNGIKYKKEESFNSYNFMYSKRDGKLNVKYLQENPSISVAEFNSSNSVFFIRGILCLFFNIILFFWGGVIGE